MRIRSWLPLVLVCGCGGGSASRQSASVVASAYGEVHLHAFTGGAHPGALFVAMPTPMSEVDGDDILADRAPTIGHAGACVVYDRACGRCSTPRLVDGGAVHVRGGFSDVDLAPDPQTGVYLPMPPHSTPIFLGGETLRIDGDGSAAAPPFRGSLTAPEPFELTAPGAAPQVTDGADFAVAWPPAGTATRVEVTLIASQNSGHWATLQCDVPDGDGGVALPAALLALLPAAPRQMQLLVSRDVIVVAPSDAAGQGVVLHAGYETTTQWEE